MVHDVYYGCAPPPMDPSLKRLLCASTAGDLPSVQAIFSEWKCTQDPVEAAKSKRLTHDMQPALEAAIRKKSPRSHYVFPPERLLY